MPEPALTPAQIHVLTALRQVGLQPGAIFESRHMFTRRTLDALTRKGYLRDLHDRGRYQLLCWPPAGTRAHTREETPLWTTQPCQPCST